MKPLLVIGGTAFGRLVRLHAEECGQQFAGFIDDFNAGPDVIGTQEALLARFSPETHQLALAIGYKHLAARLQCFLRWSSHGYRFPVLRHPLARVHASCDVGAGSIVMAGAGADPFSRLGEIVVAWPGSVVSHDSEIGRNTFLCPNATICGFCVIGESSFVGAGSVVVDNTTLPPGSFVKAGSLRGSRA